MIFNNSNLMKWVTQICCTSLWRGFLYVMPIIFRAVLASQRLFSRDLNVLPVWYEYIRALSLSYSSDFIEDVYPAIFSFATISLHMCKSFRFFSKLLLKIFDFYTRIDMLANSWNMNTPISSLFFLPNTGENLHDML